MFCSEEFLDFVCSLYFSKYFVQNFQSKSNFQICIAKSSPASHDSLAEWLRRWPAKPLYIVRVGSNPTGVVFFKTFFFFSTDCATYLKRHIGCRLFHLCMRLQAFFLFMCAVCVFILFSHTTRPKAQDKVKYRGASNAND
jgi:hypothetical protein